MPSKDLENLAVILEQFSDTPASNTAQFLDAVCANLRSLAEQVHMLEEIPIQQVQA